MKSILPIITFSFLFLVFLSCGNNDRLEQKSEIRLLEAPSVEEKSFSINANSNMSSTTSSEKKVIDVNQRSKKIIKDGNVTLATKSLASTKKRVDELVKENGGYYEVETFKNETFQYAYSLKIRIKSYKFSSFIHGVESGKEEVKSKNFETRDVTEDYYDTETRLTSQRAYLKRYQELLAKANSIQDILDIEERIRGIQEEIDSAIGHLQYLDSQVSYSTLFLNLEQEKAAGTSYQEESFFSKIGNALSNGGQGIAYFFLALLTLWPILLAGGIVWYIIRRRLKQRKLATKE